MRFRIVALLLPLALAACSQAAKPDTSAVEAAAPAPAQPSGLPRGTVTVHTQDGRALAVDVEIASDEPSRERGLMYRKAMAENAGMLFVFPEERVHSFWMRNTYLPLDMLFIDAQHRIVGVVAWAEPLTTTPRGVRAPSLYVLEVNGGWSERNRVSTGDTITVGRPSARR